MTAVVWPKCALFVSDQGIDSRLADALALSGYFVHCEGNVPAAIAYVRDVTPTVAVVGPFNDPPGERLADLLRHLSSVCEHVVVNLEPTLSVR